LLGAQLRVAAGGLARAYARSRARTTATDGRAPGDRRRDDGAPGLRVRGTPLDLALMRAGRGDWVAKVGRGVRRSGSSTRVGIAIKVGDGAGARSAGDVAVLEALGVMDDARANLRGGAERCTMRAGRR
jgi:L-asparaginase II